MDIKIGYTELGRKYSEEFDVNENIIISKLQQLFDTKGLSVSQNEVPLLIHVVIGMEGKKHAIYGFISKEDNWCIFKIDMISANIDSKPYNASETIAKAKIK